MCVHVCVCVYVCVSARVCVAAHECRQQGALTGAANNLSLVTPGFHLY